MTKENVEIQRRRISKYAISVEFIVKSEKFNFPSSYRFTEDDTAIDYFGRLLEEAGYDYYGTETMYSGIDGREMTARIFFGIVHYQRLRHMVSDKWQVSTF